MARKLLIRPELNPYHVYNRTLDKVFYERMAMPKIWKYSNELLWELSHKYGVKIHAFVLMSNHFHLLVSTPLMNIDEFMRDFQSKLCKMIMSEDNKQKFRFSGPYKWVLVRNAIQYATVLKYIYQNPVRAGITETPENYDYSTLSGKLGISPLGISLEPSDLFEYKVPNSLDEFREWLSDQLNEENLSEVRKQWTLRNRQKGGRARVKVQRTLECEFGEGLDHSAGGGS